MSNSLDELDQILALTLGKPKERKVATAEGAQFYGLPIGSIITPDVESAKSVAAASLGIQPPKGALTGGKSSSSAPSIAPVAKAPKVSKAPSLSGPSQFHVGKSEYSAPAGSKLVQAKGNSSFLYVQTPDGKLHAFTEQGQVTIPPALGQVMATKFSGDLSNDDKYEEVPFDGEGATHDISQLSIGTKLQDRNGTPQFTKTSEDEWTHDQIPGAVVTDKDLTALFEKGQLVAKETQENKSLREAFAGTDATNLADLSEPDFNDTLDKIQKIYWAGKDSDPITFSKNDDGSWTSDAAHSTDQKITTQALYFIKSGLHVGKAPKPEEPAPEDKPTSEKPKAAPKKAENKNTAPDGETPGHGLFSAYASEEEILSAGSGDEFLVGKPDGSVALYTQQDDGTWSGTNGDTGTTDDDLLGVLSDPDTEISPSVNNSNFSIGVAEQKKKAALKKQFKDEAESGKITESPDLSTQSDEKPEGIPASAIKLQSLNSVSDGSTIMQTTKAGTLSYKKTGPGEYVDTDPQMGWDWPEASLEGPLQAGELYLLTEAPETPPEVEPAPKEVSKTPEALSEKELASAPLGAMISYPDGEDYEAGYWSKVGNDEWVNSSTQAEYSTLALAGLWKYNDTEGVQLFHNPTVGAKITTTEQMDFLKPGAKLSFDSIGGDQSFYTKLNSGDWLTPGGQVLPSSSLKVSATSGKFTVNAVPEATPDGDSSALSTSFEVGGAQFSKDDIQEALTALESHSSFQISYGLKSVPNNPLANLPKDQIKIWAKDAYPDLPPKQGAVKLFKDKLGISSDAPEKNATDGPKAIIGSDAPKKAQTGLTGGEFTKAEIDDAIQILENYPGKVFKNELIKQGSPLGQLAPIEIVGFDKDKLVTKQKFLDLLKKKSQNFPITPAPIGDIVILPPENEEIPKAEPHKVTSVEELKGYPVGTVIHWKGKSSSAEYDAVKTGPGTWNATGTEVPTEGWKSAINAGYITLVDDKPNSEDAVAAVEKAVPEYAKTPEAVSEKSVDPASNLEPITDEEIANAPVGTVFVHNNGTVYTRTTGGYTSVTNGEVGPGKTVKSLQLISEELHRPEPVNPEFNKSGLAPGKYSSGGPAYMVVKADGTGVYVNSKGTVTNMTVAKVKSNHDAGMNIYHGIPDTIPSVEPKAAPKKVTTSGSIGDGMYFQGNPANAKTLVYQVAGDKVTVFKPKTSTPGVANKIGQKTTAQWEALASTGAKMKYAHAGTAYTKQEDGTWVDEGGTEIEPYQLTQAKDNYWGYWKIVSHGTQDPVEIPKKKLDTLFLQGDLLDADGNSVLPKGYSGAVSIFGAKTTIPALLAVKKFLAEDYDPENPTNIKTAFAERGVHLDGAVASKYILKNYGEGNSASQLKGITKVLDDLTADVDLSEIPESKPKELFQWDATGSAVMPDGALDNSYDIKAYKAQIAKISSQVGDGKIIGQHVDGMDIYDMKSWVGSFIKGDFATMYKLEVKAAAEKGNAHSAGYLHPGYSGNADTNQIAWGAAVPGEISALQKVEGDWSDVNLEWSAPEINNYLIKAQMQNPTHLSMQERRVWVKYHMLNNKSAVDKLSKLAQTRKNDGDAPLSDPLEWTDEIKPAKVYDSLFDNEPFPTDGWSYGKAPAWYDDNAETLGKELTDFFDKAKENASWSHDELWKNQAVIDYMTMKKEEAYQLSLIPVYTKKPTQTVKQGTHPIGEYTDQWGGEFFFKPRPETPAGHFRAEIEALGNALGRHWGYSSPEPKLVTIDGDYGLLQSKVHAEGDLLKADYSKLTAEQIADIGSEHVLDWMLDNDDTKGDNALIQADGRIVGIDKGRTMRAYGSWQGLSGTAAADSNAPTIYTKLFDAMRAKKFSKEDLDKAYLLMQRRIKRIQKSDNESIRAMVEEGMKSRDKGYDVPYKIDGKLVPQTFDGLIMAMEDRKSKLSTDFENLWASVYKDGGYGELPEAPVNPLGDVLSGIHDARLHEELQISGIGGKSTLVAGAHAIGGTAFFWKDQEEDGSQNLNGEMFLAPKAQKKILDFLKSNVEDLNPKKANPLSFNGDVYSGHLINGAKTVSQHAVDGEYNKDKIAAYEAAAVSIEQDLDAWSPDLEANTSQGDKAAFKFPSGTIIPMEQVDQYKMMLDYYLPYLDAIDKAKKEKGKVSPKLVAYTPVSLTEKPEIFSDGKGNTMTKLAGGGVDKYLSKTKTGEVSVHQGTLGDEWSLTNPPEVKAPPKFFTITKNDQTHDRTGYLKDGVKILKKNGGHPGTGAAGSEYQITLETGEKIFYRNAGHTNTAQGIQGKLSIVAPQTGTPAEIAASMERVDKALDLLGIDHGESSDYDAELTYWREMYGILHDRQHKEGTKLAKTLHKMNEKVKELGGLEDEFIEDLTAHFNNPEKEAKYWRDLWAAEYGTDKINKLIAEEGYLPKFDHQNYDHPELGTGKPYWERFDVTPEEIYAMGHLLMSTTKKDPLNQVKAGASMGAEERLRQNGQWINGWSASDDQMKGSSHNIYTRIQPDHAASEYSGFYDPRAMLRTRTYSFNGDLYGDHGQRASSAPANPLDALKEQVGGTNETSLPHLATVLDTIELYAFDHADKRDEAIQYLKAKGILMIRGLPVEDRFVMRDNIQKAIEKVKATWKK